MSIRLMPTPEQWDLVATLKGRHADKANNRLTADLAFPTFDFSYTLEVAAEPGGVKVSINLDKPLPQKLAGRAGFNLEFLPSIYMGKAYLVDGTTAGIFPRAVKADAKAKCYNLVAQGCHRSQLTFQINQFHCLIPSCRLPSAITFSIGV
jgi:hypothetical protein